MQGGQIPPYQINDFTVFYLLISQLIEFVYKYFIASIPGFWDVVPHDPIPVESTWKKFVKSANGKVVSDILPSAPNFNNADFIFPDAKVVCELKEIQTEFLDRDKAYVGLEELHERLFTENPK